MSAKQDQNEQTRLPKCPYFGQCGGCATQHLTYEIQLENKRKRLEQEIGYSDIQVYSGEEWWYRNRMDMTFTHEGLGFREKGKWWKPLAVKQCVISNKRLNELIIEINDFFGPEFNAFNVKSHEGTYKYAVIRTPQQDSSISIVLNKNSDRLDEAVKKVKDFAQKTTANHLLLTYMKDKSSQSVGEDYEVLKGSDMLEETILGKTFHYSAQGFFQNNSVMAEGMHDYVNNLLKKHIQNNGRRGSISWPAGGERVFKTHLLDLYGGVGAFGIVNADLFNRVTSVEGYEGCTIAAKANIERNKLNDKMEAICMDAKRLKQVKLPSGDELFVVTDPPRSGMSQETVIQLKKLAPKVMIYISCNVEQLGKDLPKFRDYKIKSAALFDLFPQTNHMESVVEMVKK